MSFLSKECGENVSYMVNDNILVKRYDEYLKNFVDNIDYFNISLIDDIYVTLAIGVGDYKCIGLGTADNLEHSIIKSQQEMLQYFPNKVGKKCRQVFDNNVRVEGSKNNRF